MREVSRDQSAITGGLSPACEELNALFPLIDLTLVSACFDEGCPFDYKYSDIKGQSQKLWYTIL